MTKNDNIIEAFTEIAHKYEETLDTEMNRFWGWSYHSFIDTLIDQTPIKIEQKILDIATGTAVIPIKLLNKLGKNNIHGLDITHSMLLQANHKLTENYYNESVKLTCASAMEMPYANQSFDLVFCGLATHHMNVSTLLEEVSRILRYGGKLSFADVGSSKLWVIPGVKWMLRIFAYIYYVIVEDPNRAWAEAGAVSNVRTAEEWHSQLKSLNFTNISITKLESKHFWIPSPLVIQADKMGDH
jgi:ubiquinone/menaquinone biosynthesis C-methylase UbiE